MLQPARITSIVLIACCCCAATIAAQHLPLCESLNEIDSNESDAARADVKTRRVRALCEAIYSSRAHPNDSDNDAEDVPDFDLLRITSDDDANQILKRFRRSRFSSGSSSSSSSRSSGSSSSSSGSRGGFSSRSSSFGGSSSSSSSSRGGLFSRSSSSSGSRGGLFSRSSSSGSGSSSSSSRGGLFSRSSSSGSGSSSSSSSSRGGLFSRSSSSSSGSPSSSRGGLFSRSSSSSSSSSSGNHHRVREAFRSLVRKPSSSGSTIRSSSGSGALAGSGGSKPSLSDKIRKITHGGGSAGGFGTGGSRYSSGFGGGSRYGSGISGGGFGGSSGTGGNAWVRAGKKFLPVAVRFGKRYYQRRKYSKGMYAGMGAGAGYYAGSRMNNHRQHHYYPNDNYGYPPASEHPPTEVDGAPPTVFYCIQEDLNATLVNQTLNAEGFGVCNISGELVTCPIEIECQTSEADTCCEDEQGAPMCCGGSIPDEAAAQYGGYSDDAYDAASSMNDMLNIVTAVSILLATVCLRMWRREE